MKNDVMNTENSPQLFHYNICIEFYTSVIEILSHFLLDLRFGQETSSNKDDEGCWVLNLQSLHELTCTESPVAKFKAEVAPPKEDKMNAWLFGLNLKNKVAFLKYFYERGPSKSWHSF